MLVTGGAGYLGSHVSRQVREAGHDVIAIDRAPPSDAMDVLVHRADLNDLASVLPLFADVDVVIHTAALHGVHLSTCDGDTFFSNNVRSTFNVLQACQDHRVPRLVFTSSVAVHGAAGDPDGAARWIVEDLPRRWRRDNLYHLTKVLCEDLCQHFAVTHGAMVTALRCTRFCLQMDVEDNVRKLAQGVDVRDAACAHVLAALRRFQPGFSAYVIAARVPFQPDDARALYDDAHSVIERYFPGAVDAFARRAIDLPRSIGRVHDIGRARRELGFQPSHNFAELLEDL